ncbi:MAG TPA: maleylpyruvate isomerase family mycothiol-dependent enzyme [Streptosporangiaceae bacterium]|jgi:uncharacterized protein (TIGR03083 family)|nr:maleylpyruvate isomerase family mycothiol-dependent enzyme [Streptosporangiaceae bacterium]
MATEGEQPADPRLRGPWPLATAQTRAELTAYLATAADPALAGKQSLCPAWTVSQVTAHLAATFARFAGQLVKSRGGDLSPPFAADELSTENLRAVERFSGDPDLALRDEVGRFLALATDPGELMAHQFGPIPAGLQVLFGLNELAVHHYDVTAPHGPAYRPPDPVLALLADVHGRVNGLPSGGDVWDGILRQTGRKDGG